MSIKKIAGYKRLMALAVLAAFVAPAAAQCGTDPGNNPFSSCPAGTHRIRDVTRPPSQQWVCAGQGQS